MTPPTPHAWANDHDRLDEIRRRTHLAIAAKIDADPALLDLPRRNIQRWAKLWGYLHPAYAEWLARISHQPLDAMTKLFAYPMVAEIAMGLSDHRLRWPRPRRSFGPVRAHATSTVGPAMLSVASTHTEPKSSAIIAATGEKCGLGILERPWPEIRQLLVADDENSKRLRQSTPFVGVLSPWERRTIHESVPA